MSTAQALHLDLETRSAAELKKVGTCVYARHDTTDVWCAAFAFDQEDPALWIPGEPVPERIVDHVYRGGPIYAWNSYFERMLWKYVLTPRYGWPKPIMASWRDPMVYALAMSFPAALDQCAHALGLQQAKDMEGRRLMLQMAKPRRIESDGRTVWWDAPEKRERLYEYCRQDVRAEMEACEKLLPLSNDEQQNWLIDQAINDRGVKLDEPLIRKMIAIADRRFDRLTVEMALVTGGSVTAVTQTGALGEWVRNQGFPMESVDKDAVTAALQNLFLPDHVKCALKIRREAGKSSIAKLERMLQVADNDSRARGLFQFHRAGTGRWASTGIQFQNLPRGGAVNMDELAADIMRSDRAERPDDMLDMIYGDCLSILSTGLRGCIIAGHGNKLLIADYSQIEARINAWLAGAEHVLDVFRAWDAGHGQDVYVYQAEQIGSDSRQLGKVLVLACGFGMGGEKFQTTAAKGPYYIELTREEAFDAVAAYRESNPEIVTNWYALDDAAKAALRRPGTSFPVADGRVVYKRANGHLWCRLPSGRTLCYPYAAIQTLEKTFKDKEGNEYKRTVDQIAYMGVDSLTKQWTVQYAYGGLLCENIVQGIAADMLRVALRRCHDAGFGVVMHTHDEVVAEVPARGERTLAEFQKLLVDVPDFLKGCPIKASGFETTRYRKD